MLAPHEVSFFSGYLKVYKIELFKFVKVKIENQVSEVQKNEKLKLEISICVKKWQVKFSLENVCLRHWM